MRLLVDANISHYVVASLCAEGHDVLYIGVLDPNASDSAILRRAVRERRIVITYDKDFGELVFRDAFKHSGVVLVRTRDETAASVQQLLSHFFSRHTAQEIHGSFWVLADQKTRRVQQESFGA